MFLSKTDFSKVVSATPLIAIDFCIIKDKKILLGKRSNPPAKDFFFVPGGRIRKSERIKKAFERILRNELGFHIKQNQNKLIKSLGIYEHFYDNNFLDNNDFSTHYIVIAYLVPHKSLTKKVIKIKSPQHSEYIWLDIKNKENCTFKVHKNTLEYLENPLIKNL